MPIIATIQEDQPTELEKRLLMSLVFSSKLDEDEKEEMMNKVNNCTDYTGFMLLQYKLEYLQPSFHEIAIPSKTQIKNHIERITR